jgi:hypothetical protein
MPRYPKDRQIDMDYLLRDFRQFWHANGDAWLKRCDDYPEEAALHLVMMTFLQRVVNGGRNRPTRPLSDIRKPEISHRTENTPQRPLPGRRS